MTDRCPIALFVYNRFWHTKQTVEALEKNEMARESELFIFSDGAKNSDDIKKVEIIRNYIKKIKGFGNITIIERENNLGLAKSIRTGVTEILNKYGKIIVLEDDLITSPYFLKYMNEALDFYEKNDNIYSITGYNLPPSSMKIPKQYKHDVYFNPRPMSWSWATWKNRWDSIDWDVKEYKTFLNDVGAQNKFNGAGGNDLTDMLIRQMNGDIDSWYIIWCFTHYQKNALCVYPTKSMVINIGHDASGVHCRVDKNGLYTHKKLEDISKVDFTPVIDIDIKIMERFRNGFCGTNCFRPIKYISPRLYYRKIKKIIKIIVNSIKILEI